MKETKASSVEPGKWRQFIAAIVANLIALSYGMIIGWASPSIPILKSADSPLGPEPLSDEQLSWLNSIICLSGMPLFPVCSWMAEKFGRKMTACFIAIPCVISWLLTIFATQYYYLFAARVIGGIAGAFVFLLIPLYVAEISADSIRGQLGSLMVFAINIGILLGYILGAVLSYQLFAITALIIPMIFFGCFIFMPETPPFLVRKDRIADATKSLMWLKSGDKYAVDRELERLQALAKENSNVEKSVGLRDLFRDRGTIKGLIIALALLCGQQTCGITAMLTYTAMIFDMAGSSLKPNIATIIIGTIQIFGSWLSTVFMERAGRKTLILVSCFGMLLCHCTLATFLYIDQLFDIKDTFGWVPLAALSVYAIVYCLGMGPAPFVVVSEIFSPDIAALATSVVMTIMFSVAFTVVKCFPLLISLLGMYGCFYVLAIFCGITAMFTIFVVPETKGRSIESIIHELNGFSGRCTDNGYVKASVDINEKNIHTSTV